MGNQVYIWLGTCLAITGIGVLRLSWGRATRSSELNLTGWSLLGLAIICGGAGAGAWGVSVVSLGAMTAAGALLLVAASQPSARRRSAKRILRNQNGEIAGGRMSKWGAGVTFLVAGPLCLLASLALALAIRELILIGGGAEANGNVAVLGVVPLVWPVLAYAVMMMQRRSYQLALIAGVAAISVPLLLSQGMTA